MQAAIEETDRRRAIQLAYNEEHGITAATIVKGVSDISDFLTAESKTPKRRRRASSKTRSSRRTSWTSSRSSSRRRCCSPREELRFEYAARLRDELRELRRTLAEEIRAEEAPPPAEKAAEDFRRGHALGSGPLAVRPPGERRRRYRRRR